MISLGTALLFLGIIGLIWFWVDALKSQEKALAAARNACDRSNAQLLDETVVLRKLNFRLLFSGKGLGRRYSFCYDSGRNQPQESYILMQGKTVMDVGLFKQENKIIAFPDRKAANQ